MITWFCYIYQYTYIVDRLHCVRTAYCQVPSTTTVTQSSMTSVLYRIMSIKTQQTSLQMTRFPHTTLGSIRTNCSRTVCTWKRKATAMQECIMYSGELIVNQDSSVLRKNRDNRVVSAWNAAVNLSQGIDNLDLVH